MIKTYYDGVLIDASDESTLLNRTIFITDPGGKLKYKNMTSIDPLIVNKITFEPINQGLPSTYFFSFTLPIALTLFNQLVITFPDSYDKRLGDNLLAYLDKNDESNQVRIDFSVSNRHVMFK